MATIDDQFRCALIIVSATHKLSRNSQLELFRAFQIDWPFQPAHTRKPLPQIHSLYFAHSPPLTYTDHIKHYNCWTGLMECCSQSDQALIYSLATGKTKWLKSIHESATSPIHPSSQFTNVPENSSSTNLTHRLNNLKIKLARSPLLMGTP